MSDKDMITVEDKEYDVAEMTAEQQMYVAHLRNLNTKAANMRMDLDQLQAAYNAFSNTLTASLQEEDTDEVTTQ